MSCKDGECTCKDKQHARTASVILFPDQKVHNTSADIFTTSFNEFQMAETIAEIRFKNGRKGLYRNNKFLKVEKDQRLVVQENTGWDLGTVNRLHSETELHENLNIEKPAALPSILRIASSGDLEQWLTVRKKDKTFLSDCRSLIKKNGLNFYINDVEISTDEKRLRVYSTGDQKETLTIGALLSEKYRGLFNSIIVEPS